MIGVLGRLAGVLLLAAPGCTALLDFDECTGASDCDRFGAGPWACVEGQCRSTVAGPTDAETYADLLVYPCQSIYGVDANADISDDVIVLGTLLPSTGDLGQYGPPIDRAVELGVIEINQAGGLFGKTLAVVSCDSGKEATDPPGPGKAEKAAAHLASIGVPAIIGAASSTTSIEVFTKVAKDAGMLMISPASTSPALTAIDDNGLLWRTAPSDALQGKAIANFLVDEKQGFRTIAVVNRADAYGDGLSNAISEELCLGEFDFDCSENFIARSYDPTTYEDDQSQIIVELKGEDPDVIVLIGYLEDGINFIKLAEAAALDKFILTDGTKSDQLLQAGISTDVLCKVIGTNPASPSGTTFQSFSLRYEKKWAQPPGAFNANAYDAIYVLGYAMAAALGKTDGPLTGPQIALELSRLSSGQAVPAGNSGWGEQTLKLKSSDQSTIDFVGASGALDFDADLGEADGNIEAFFFDLAKSEVSSLGEFYTADGTYTDPGFTPECPGG